MRVNSAVYLNPVSFEKESVVCKNTSEWLKVTLVRPLQILVVESELVVATIVRRTSRHHNVGIHAYLDADLNGHGKQPPTTASVVRSQQKKTKLTIISRNPKIGLEEPVNMISK